MSDLNELYQEVILDHNRNPRNFHALEKADYKAEGYNPLCGDHYTFYVKMNGDKIEDLGFEGSGCAISKASSSLMSAEVKGKNKEAVFALFEKFHKLLTGKPGENADPTLGKLAVFSGVCEFPSRVKCASLGWHTLKAALEGKGEKISTE